MIMQISGIEIYSIASNDIIQMIKKRDEYCAPNNVFFFCFVFTTASFTAMMRLSPQNLSKTLGKDHHWDSTMSRMYVCCLDSDWEIEGIKFSGFSYGMGWSLLIQILTFQSWLKCMSRMSKTCVNSEKFSLSRICVNLNVCFLQNQTSSNHFIL